MTDRVHVGVLHRSGDPVRHALLGHPKRRVDRGDHPVELGEQVVLVVERSVELGDKDWQRQVTDAFDAFARMHDAEGLPSQEDPQTWSLLHRAFHSILFQACDSPWMLRFIETLADHSERYRMLGIRHGQRHSLKEHEDIYRAAMAPDPAAAREALIRHLDGTVEFLSPLIPPVNG